jgi:hypothetical protein
MGTRRPAGRNWAARAIAYGAVFAREVLDRYLLAASGVYVATNVCPAVRDSPPSRPSICYLSYQIE